MFISKLTLNIFETINHLMQFVSTLSEPSIQYVQFWDLQF
jgi:hypothetical protein